jgi:hypothetical protein
LTGEPSLPLTAQMAFEDEPLTWKPVMPGMKLRGERLALG